MPPEAPTSVAQMLQTYGPWGFVTVLMSVVAVLFKAYVGVRDRHDAAQSVQTKGAIDLVEECTKASVEQRNAIVNVTEALRAIERRLENVEKKFG